MRSRSSWFWVGALALLGVSACNKKKPDRNAPVKVDNRPPFSLVSTRPPIQMGTSLASLLPSDTLLFVELKSLASMHRWLKVDALRKRLGGKADKLLVSVDVVNPYDPQDARAAGLDLARPVAFFIDAYKVSIYGFAFSLTDPALYVARYKSRAVGHTMRKEGATTVLSYKNRRVLIRGKRALVLFSAASAGELDARVKRYGEVRTATSLAKNPLYREGLNALSYGDDLFLFARRMLLVDRLIPQLAGRGLTPGTAFFQKVYRPVKAMLVGLNVTAGEITAKLHLSVPKKSGLFTMFHIGKPALGWTVVQQNALIAFRFQVDLPRYLAYFVKTMSSMESYAKGLAPILDKPIAGGMSPRQVLKTLSGRLEFYLTAPPELHKLTDLDGALFVGLKETKSFEAFLEAALKKAPPGQVKSETIAGVPFHVIAALVGKTFYFAVVRDHFVITANRGLAERWVNGTRQSYVDRLSATHKKMAVSNNAFYMTLDLARYGRLIFAGTAGRRSSKRERGLAILNALGSLAMNMFPTPAGFDSYFLWTPGPGGVTAAVHALFELAALTGVRSEERSQACKAKCASAIAEARRKCPLGPSHAACVKVVDDAAINCAKACEKY